MRTYTFLASRPGGFMFYPPRTVTADWKIRFVVILMFRKWFGREPNFHWHVDGFMAGARDERGNEVELHQVNDEADWLPQLPFRYANAVRHKNWYLATRYLGEMLAIPALPAPSSPPTVGFHQGGTCVYVDGISRREFLKFRHKAAIEGVFTEMHRRAA